MMQHRNLAARLPVGRPAAPGATLSPWRRWSLPAALLAVLGLLIGPNAWATDITSCPFKITVPGSYTVTQDLSCPSTTKPAIEVDAQDVTLSLGGHTITGPGRTQFQATAILVNDVANAQISNGTISSFGIAVDLSSGTTDSGVSGLTVTNCDDGIEIEFGTDFTTVNSNTFSSCDVAIAIGGPNNTITGNTANGNETGITINDDTAHGNMVVGNTALGNTTVDLEDVNSHCDSNTWMNNCFGTESQSCIGTPHCGAASPITCPANQTVTAAAGQTTATVDVGTPTTTPPGLPVVGVRADGQALTDPYPLGATTITWTVNPGQENSATCTQTITVQAPGAPNLTCPGNKTATVPTGQSGATVAVGTATSTTEGATIVGVRSDGKALTAPYPVGTTTITWMATLDELPPATCVETITVQAVNPFPIIVRGPSQADPVIESIRVDRGPLYQRAIIHGRGFADIQGTSFVTLGGHEIPVLDWTDDAIAVLINPMAFDQAALALNAAYPVQVVIPANGKKSNTVDFFLTDGPPAPGYPNIGSAALADPPRFGAIQPGVVCPGGTVAFLGSGFGAVRGTGYVSVQVPLGDRHGSVVTQAYAEPVLGWTGSTVEFALLLPAGALPGTYTATVHRSTGQTATGSFLVGAPDSRGQCVPALR